MTDSTRADAPLTGGRLWLAALFLAAANFIAVLNMTIANVSVPNIAGALGATTSQGTWVITSYAVGEAITVPLTGWLAARLGAVRVFVGSMALFGLFSAVCGLANSLGLLVVARIFQGFSGGPLMPLSQTLLMRIFPKEKVAAAIGLWSMTTLVAPVVGPILGGYLCDEYSWPWVFFLNTPVALVAAAFAWQLLKRYGEPLARNPIDKVGLALLVVWVAALQLMLDEGKDLDWFASAKIVGLAVTAAVGFAAFIIWELYERHPVVDLRVFRHRGFTVSVLTISLAFAAFFGVNVLTPLWLQSFMGYTATISGLATAWTGVTAIFLAPLVAHAATKTDPRRLVFAGVVWLGLVTLWRTVATTDMGFWDVAVPLMVMGFGLPFFFIPTTGLALASVEPREMDSAAGLMNFLRTLSGAFATSLVSTAWSDQIIRNHAELVAVADTGAGFAGTLGQSGMAPDAVREAADYLLTNQAVMLATNQLMTVIGLAFLVAASVIWLAPKPMRVVEPGAGGH
ncbi:DHA2 family efflux MFS transporter permease subunit [Parasulfuritortus cantonensis]|uniref:DHA2 family efflux MFS transporter permease subunit n=1 Tax=Parasulfuritortus cantonensis TaxID=2528202 RepID=A0A4R1B8T3_9PROT|nr:DHA2 family efflux MFS transporter permease subunit [Parasulfuritortus cantonensis]TCJ12753.1 DHA2 family efflux MFS transporter permease subunit [Parasulfuritortus cantonensis]